MQAIIQQQLKKALQSLNKQYADLLTDPMTEITVYDAPFLSRYQIYGVEHFDPYASVFFYVGFAERQRAYILTGTPENYVKMFKADGAVIAAVEPAARYAATYLDVTRSMKKLFYLVRSVDEVKFRPNLSGDEAQARAAFIDQYRPVITPPSATLTSQGYQVTLYAVREQALERHTLTVKKKGEIQDQLTVLAQSLPLVYGV